MEINTAKYLSHKNRNISIWVELSNGKFMSVPLDPANTDYAEIMRQVEAGELTIQEADSE
jgi:hypothetical protein